MPKPHYALSFQDPSDAPLNSSSLFGDYGWTTSAGIALYHLGDDYLAPNGSNVYATANGYIEEIGDQGSSGFGKYIIIRHEMPNGDTIYSLYAHLEDWAIGLDEGMAVDKGDIIALSGHTGAVVGTDTDGDGIPDTDGAHLHFEISSTNGFIGNGPLAGGYDQIGEAGFLGDLVNGGLTYNPASFISTYSTPGAVMRDYPIADSFISTHVNRFTDGGFESGTLSEWTTLGTVQAVTQYALQTDGGDVTTAVEGNWFAAIDAEGTISVDQLESFLGLASGSISTTLGLTAYEGSAMQRTITVTGPSADLYFDFIFDAGDYLPYDDAALLIVDGQIVEIMSVADVGDYGSTAWIGTGVTDLARGDHTIGLAVVDVGDGILSSALYVDDFQLV